MTAKRVATTVLAHTSPMEIAIVKAISLTPWECGGPCVADADMDGICDDIDPCVGALDACGICNDWRIYECGCFDIPEGDWTAKATSLTPLASAAALCSRRE